MKGKIWPALFQDTACACTAIHPNPWGFPDGGSKPHWMLSLLLRWAGRFLPIAPGKPHSCPHYLKICVLVILDQNSPVLTETEKPMTSQQHGSSKCSFLLIFHFSTLLAAQVSSYILPAGWNNTWPWFFPCLLTHTFSFLLLSLSFENKTSFQHFALTIKAAAKGYDLQICQVSEEPRSNRDQTESAFPAATLQSLPAPGISQSIWILCSPLTPLERWMLSVLSFQEVRKSNCLTPQKGTS